MSQTFQLEDGDPGTPFWPDQKVNDSHAYLFAATPGCPGEVVSAPGGGVKCRECKGWYCE